MGALGLLGGVARAEAPALSQSLCDGRTLAEVEVRGARRVTADDVRSYLALRVGEACDPAAVEFGSRKLWQLGLFDDLRIEGEARGKQVALRIFVKERPAVGAVRFEGNSALDEEDLLEKIKLEAGEILSIQEVKQQLEPLQNYYIEEGYYLAKVDYKLEPSNERQGEVDVVFVIEEGEATVIRSIEISGNRALGAEELRGVMQLGETHIWSFVTSTNVFNKAALDEDLLRIQALYYDRGFLTTELGAPQVTLSADKRFIDILIPVEEGPRYRVRELRVQEVDDAGLVVEALRPMETLEAPFEGQAGEWFSRSQMALGIQAVRRMYRDEGYAFTEVTPGTAIDDNTRLVDVTVRIKRGPKVYIERINIRGNTTTRDKVIRRELKLSEGELYSESLVERSKNRVQALGFFETVSVSETRGSEPDLLVLEVEVTERSTGTFQVGAGFSSIESFILTAQVQQQNLLGRGQSLALQLQLSGIRQLIQARFVEPYFLDTDWSLGVDGFKTIRQFQDFTRDSTGGGMTFGHPIYRDELRAFLQYRGEIVDIDTRTGGLFGGGRGAGFNIFRRIPLANLFRDGFTSSLTFTLNWDSRDNRLLPTKGIYGSLSTEVADGFLGSDNVFVRNAAIGRFYKPLWKGLVLKLNTEVGLISSRLNRGVPIFERYFLGGIFNLRGFPLQSVGPRVGLPLSADPNASVPAEGVVIGGNMQAFYNLELEFPIVQAVGIRGVIFTDGGNAWNLESSLCELPEASLRDSATDHCGLNPLALRTSWGFGIRWLSPLGPLRFEWGVPFRPRSYEAPIRFEFTIGNFF